MRLSTERRRSRTTRTPAIRFPESAICRPSLHCVRMVLPRKVADHHGLLVEPGAGISIDAFIRPEGEVTTEEVPACRAMPPMTRTKPIVADTGRPLARCPAPK